jgi:hypothetical protein
MYGRPLSTSSSIPWFKRSSHNRSNFQGFFEVDRVVVSERAQVEQT